MALTPSCRPAQIAIVACAFAPMLPRGAARSRRTADVKSFTPGRTTLILAAVACVLTMIAITINYFRGGRVQFSHCLLALGLLAFVVWFSGRRDDEED